MSEELKCIHCGVPIKPDWAAVKPHIVREPKGTRLAIVGEAPGKDEQRRGIPFVGYSGRLLRKTLQALGYDDDEILFTNICCHRPMDEKGKDRKPTGDEMFLGRQRLFNELREFKPDRILSVGNTAYQGLFNVSKATISKIRGEWRDVDLGDGLIVPVMPTWHPAALLRDASPFKEFCLDIENWSKPIPAWEYPETVVCESYEEFSRIWNSVEFPDHGLINGKHLITADIETSDLSYLSGAILCISLSYDKDKAIVVTGNALKDIKTVKLLEEIAHWDEFVHCGHNFKSFDEPYIAHHFGFKWDAKHDSILLHYTLDERLGTHGLKLLSKNMRQIPDYSEVVKKYVVEEGTTYADIPADELYKYAGMDTAVNWDIFFDLLTGLEAEPYLRRPYEMMMGFAPTLAEIENNGILLDTEYLKILEVRWLARIKLMTEEIQQISGKHTLKPRSAKQLAVVLFDDLGLDVVETTKAGNRATGKAILKKLRLQLDLEKEGDAEISKLLDLVLDARSLMQQLSTYVKGYQKRLHVDGKVRPHLKLFGSATGRLSASNPNVQNISKHSDTGMEVRRAFIASPGHVFIEADYSTLEVRIAAWYSRDRGMIDAFSRGVDIHRYVGSKVYKKPPELITFDERFRMKFIVFGAAYGRQAPSIAEELKCTVGAAQKLLDEFFAEFPDFYKWTLKTKEHAWNNGFVESAFGRRRRWDLILDNNREEIGREAINMPIQSMASDLNLYALCRIHKEVSHNKSRVLFPVHDSIMSECRIDCVEEVLPKIVLCMEDIESYGIENRGFSFKSEVAIGCSWGTMTEVKTLKKNNLSVQDALQNFKTDRFWHIKED